MFNYLSAACNVHPIVSTHSNKNVNKNKSLKFQTLVFFISYLTIVNFYITNNEKRKSNFQININLRKNAELRFGYNENKHAQNFNSIANSENWSGPVYQS